MNYKLLNDQTENNRRVITYVNDTGTEVKITPIYTDKNNVNWWGFIDLHKVPYIRLALSKHLQDLFTMGLGLQDIVNWCNEEKEILKSNDPEKYEKLYALVLEKERLAKHTADPIKKHLALCTVYILEEGERIDYFDEEAAGRKMKIWAADLEATSFFLTWHTERINSYLNPLIKTSRIVSKQTKTKS